MRILAQTGGPRSIAARCLRAGMLLSAVCMCAAASQAGAQEAQVQCVVTQNGLPARGSFAVEQSGKQVASGSCGRTVSAPSGKLKVIVRLEGALDNPAQTVEVTAKAGKPAAARVDFKTAVLEVRIETKGRRGTGIVAVEKNGKRIGTIPHGVPATLSAGRYDVVVRLDGSERRQQVDLRPGQRRLVRAQF